MNKKIVTGEGVSSTSSGRLVIWVLMLLPLMGIGMLVFVHLDDIRRWRWDSVEHWMLLASVVFVVASHVLMLVLLCTRPKNKSSCDENRTG
ncbi:hypothetical protein [Variovorax boronicumulans]|uniref:hypothetical protein n=1 Tax=Variovorax boronicumulans TaxID=436515 RepID=UPI002473C1BD|nr:hypothetical protein [Variovorax boronicumulans]